MREKNQPNHPPVELKRTMKARHMSMIAIGDCIGTGIFVALGDSLLSELKYTSKFYPFGPIFAIILCTVIILGQNYAPFTAENIDWFGIEEADLSQGYAKHTNA